MAETTTTSSPKTPAKRSTTKRSTTPRKRTTTRKTGAAKSPSRSTARGARTTAQRETREAAAANVRAAKVTAKHGRNVAERAALVYVGVTLEARDRALALVGDLPTTSKLERRGATARTRVERDVRKAGKRLERELRAERIVRRNRADIEREADRRPNVVAEQVARVEYAVQAFGAAGEKLATTAKERVTAIA
jgi:hypothetical protein